MSFPERLASCASSVEAYLAERLAGGTTELDAALRYAAKGGKRLRAFLVMEGAALFDVPREQSVIAGAAIEALHAYSLVHDDLPCMDDDPLRRGQPTVHVKWDEATAVLAGDALLTLAFKILANRETHQDPHIRLKLLERLADCSGALGMVGGQMIDMLEDESPRDLNTITRMQRLKTGALISYSVEAGGIIGGATEAERQALYGFAHDLGLAYQISDDLLDATGDVADVGKPLRTDAEAGKANFVTLLGVEQAQERVRLLAAQAKEHLAIFRNRANILLQSVDFVLDRKH